MNQPLISVVSPVYKANNTIDALVERTSHALSQITTNFEIILVEDGSPDDSWYKIQQNCQSDARIKGIRLSRNFGQHYAITAGLDHARGEWVVVMDCDLQDRPEEISRLYQKAEEGYQVVLAQRHRRQDNFFKRWLSWVFYKLLTYLTGTKQDPTVANFGIYHQQVIQSICQMRESIRVFPIMVRWVGFQQTKIAVQHAPREEGKSTYSFKRRFNLALDIILAYSDKPIRLTIKIGLFIAFFAFVVAVVILFQYLFGYIKVSGYTSLMISIWFLAGLMMMILGVIGLYIGKTFEGVKNRPVYLIQSIENL